MCRYLNVYIALKISVGKDLFVESQNVNRRKSTGTEFIKQTSEGVKTDIVKLKLIICKAKLYIYNLNLNPLPLGVSEKILPDLIQVS